MRTQPHKSQNVGIGLLVDQNEVRFDVAVPMIFPFADECVIAVLAFGLALVRFGLQPWSLVLMFGE